MIFGRLGVLATALAAMSVACSQGTSAGGADAGTDGVVDAPSMTDASSGLACPVLTDAGADATFERPQALGDAETGPAPTGLPAIRILDAPAILVGSGPDSCVRASNGHTFCAGATAAGSRGATALIVVDVTAAIAGSPPVCGAGNARCLVLHDNLDTSALSAHAFHGETLIFRGAEGFFAWRPAWPRAQRLTGPDGLWCGTGRQGAYVACTAGAAPPFVVLAGRLGPDGETLCEQGHAAYSILALSPSEEALAWVESTSGDAVYRMAYDFQNPAAANPVVFASHGSHPAGVRWVPDGQRLFWQGSSGSFLGLFVSSFPPSGPPLQIAGPQYGPGINFANALDDGTGRDRGLVYYRATQRRAQGGWLLREGQPLSNEQGLVLAEGMCTNASFSRSLTRYHSIGGCADGDGSWFYQAIGIDPVTGAPDAGMGCRIAARNAPGDWPEPAAMTDNGRTFAATVLDGGQVTDLDSCTALWSTPAHPSAIQPAGDRGFVIALEKNGVEAPLVLVGLEGLSAPQAVSVNTRAVLPFWIASEGGAIVVAVHSGQKDADGLWLIENPPWK